MNITKVPLSALRKPERNVRLHSNKQIEEFKRSINMFGQIRPIVCDENHTILAGNGLFEALLALGYTEADCYVVENLSESEKKKLMLVDNRIFSLGVDDMVAFDEIIAELNNDFDIPGYDADLLQTLSFDFTGADEAIAGYGTITEEKKQAMHNASEAYAEEMTAFEQTATRIEPSEVVATAPVPPLSHGNNSIGLEKKTVETPPAPLDKRFVVCPKCGERIWL